MDRAYLGHMRKDGETDDAWEERSRGKTFPKYALATVETIKAAIDDDMPTLKITPSVVTADRVKGAKCLEEAIAYQRRQLGFAGERTKFIDQALRRGASIGKIPWIYETQMVRKRKFVPEEDPAKALVSQMRPDGYMPAEETVVKQGAGFLCVDVKNCPWDAAATRWEDVTYLFFKTWVTLDELKRMQKLGAYDWPADAEPKPGDGGEKDKKKGRILLIERWELRSDGVHLTVVVNRNLVIRDCPTPLEHHRLPFVFASTNPGLFTVEGISEVEIVMEEQAAIWELLNQSLLNAKYQNNATWFIDETLRNAIDIKLGPGEMNWVAGDPSTRIKQFQPVQTLQFAQPLIEMLIEQMHAVSPANPYMSGSSADAGVNDTATGIQLIQNMAGKRIQRKKEEILKADQEIGRQQILLTQMLLPKAVVYAIEDSTATDGYRQVTIDPAAIQGEFDYQTEEIADAVSKMQRKQEAGNMVATMISIATAAAAPLPPGAVPIINFRALAEFYAEASDQLPDKFLTAPAVPVAPAVPAPVPGILGSGPVPGLAGAPPAPAPASNGIPASPGPIAPLPPRGV